jgi:hypothetical protein
MSNYFRRSWLPGGLYWRVTLSYFLVTLVAVVVIEGASIFLPFGSTHQGAGVSVPRSASGVSSSSTAPAQSDQGDAPPQTLPRKLAAYLTRLQPATFYFLLLAVVVGTLTGLVVTRDMHQCSRSSPTG